MTRKDYQLIAAELERSLPEHRPSPEANDYRRIGFALAVEAVARALGRDNPRFDQSRFYRAVYGMQPFDVERDEEEAKRLSVKEGLRRLVEEEAQDAVRRGVLDEA